MIPKTNCTEVEEIGDGICFAGQSSNQASFLPRRYYSQKLSVDKCVRLAAYAVKKSGEIDSLLIGGCDIAVYPNSHQKFEFMLDAEIQDIASRMDSEMRNVISNGD